MSSSINSYDNKSQNFEPEIEDWAEEMDRVDPLDKGHPEEMDVEMGTGEGTAEGVLMPAPGDLPALPAPTAEEEEELQEMEVEPKGTQPEESLEPGRQAFQERENLRRKAAEEEAANLARDLLAHYDDSTAFAEQLKADRTAPQWRQWIREVVTSSGYTLEDVQTRRIKDTANTLVNATPRMGESVERFRRRMLEKLESELKSGHALPEGDASKAKPAPNRPEKKVRKEEGVADSRHAHRFDPSLPPSGRGGKGAGEGRGGLASSAGQGNQLSSMAMSGGHGRGRGRVEEFGPGPAAPRPQPMSLQSQSRKRGQPDDDSSLARSSSGQLATQQGGQRPRVILPLRPRQQTPAALEMLRQEREEQQKLQEREEQQKLQEREEQQKLQEREEQQKLQETALAEKDETDKRKAYLDVLQKRRHFELQKINRLSANFWQVMVKERHVHEMEPDWEAKQQSLVEEGRGAEAELSDLERKILQLKRELGLDI